jgi:DNA (cytosine-5)-methyltransferase 1
VDAVTLTVGSLCSGYESTGLGLHLAGWTHRLAFVADPDPAASKALAYHHPDVPNLGDIGAVDWANLERVDLLHMGFPCTDLSCAGRRQGLAAGTRSGVWAHCAEAIDRLQPPLVLIENVPGLLSTPANRSTDGTDGDVEPGPAGLGVASTGPVLRAAGAVVGDLADLGYDAVWTTVSAASVGAPHRRNRVFILAWPAADPVGVGLRLRSVAQPRRGGPAVAGDVGEDRGALTLLPTPESSDSTGGRVSAQLGGVRPSGSKRAVTLATAVAHALLPTPTARDDDSRANGMPLGAAVNLLPTPAVADARGTRNAPANRSGVKPTTNDAGWTLSDVAFADRWGTYGPAINRWEHVTGRPAPDPTEPGKNGQPRLSAAFVEWMQGLPAGYVTDIPGITRNDALRLLGNSNPPQLYAAAVQQLAAAATAVTGRGDLAVAS